MEPGQGSRCGRRPRPRRHPRQRRAGEGMSYEESVENLSRLGRRTLGVVNQRHTRPVSTIPGTRCTIFDRSSPPYNWLRPGWLAEERCMPDDRFYRYYYDPVGQMYLTRHEVDLICNDIDKTQEVIVLDD